MRVLFCCTISNFQRCHQFIVSYRMPVFQIINLRAVYSILPYFQRISKKENAIHRNVRILNVNKIYNGDIGNYLSPVMNNRIYAIFVYEFKLERSAVKVGNINSAFRGGCVNVKFNLDLPPSRLVIFHQKMNLENELKLGRCPR